MHSKEDRITQLTAHFVLLLLTMAEMCIRDRGMDEQELELLRESMERTETEEGSIGLANVHQSIRLFLSLIYI